MSTAEFGFEAGQTALVGGGCRSGKSEFAERLVHSTPPRSGSRYYLATGVAVDDEMRTRIAEHRQRRGRAYQTIECPLDLEVELKRLAAGDTVLVDSLGTWLANLMHRGDDDATIAAHIETLRHCLRASPATIVAVTDEVGLSIVPENRLARRFRDLQGTLNQAMAAATDHVYFACMGMILRLKPGPVVAAHPNPAPAAPHHSDV